MRVSCPVPKPRSHRRFRWANSAELWQHDSSVRQRWSDGQKQILLLTLDDASGFLIAAGLSPFAPEDVAIKAGRLMLEEIDHCANKGESFVFETTLAGQGYLRHISRWKEQGYHIELFFLALPTPEAAVVRVAERILQGGHAIPEPIIRRRFFAGLQNFDRHYKRAVHAWAKFDSVGEEPTLLECGENP